MANIRYRPDRLVRSIIVNDFLKFNFHIGKVLIENKNTTLDDGDIALLLSENKKTGSLIEDIFTGIGQNAPSAL